MTYVPLRDKRGEDRHIMNMEADGSDAATSQGMPGATRSWKRQGGIHP